MEEIREIGLEKEVFLLKNNKIMEPRLFGFPHDEMQFLVEIRSFPSDRFYPIWQSISMKEVAYRLRANKFGMELSDIPFINASKNFTERIAAKYKIPRLGSLKKSV